MKNALPSADKVLKACDDLNQALHDLAHESCEARDPYLVHWAITEARKADLLIRTLERRTGAKKS